MCLGSVLTRTHVQVASTSSIPFIFFHFHLLPPSTAQTSASSARLHNLDTAVYYRNLPIFFLFRFFKSNCEMLNLSIIFLLNLVALVTSQDSCSIQTCSASKDGETVAAIYDTAIPYAGGQNDADAVTNFLTLNCGLNPQITQCYVDCNGIYGGSGAYWTDQMCRSQCGISVNCFGYTAWFCSTATSNVCQVAAPSAPTNNPTAATTAQTIPTSTPLTPTSSGGLSETDKIALGTSIPFGIITIAIGLTALSYQIRTGSPLPPGFWAWWHGQSSSRY